MNLKFLLWAKSEILPPDVLGVICFFPTTLMTKIQIAFLTIGLLSNRHGVLATEMLSIIRDKDLHTTLANRLC